MDPEAATTSEAPAGWTEALGGAESLAIGGGGALLIALLAVATALWVRSSRVVPPPVEPPVVEQVQEGPAEVPPGADGLASRFRSVLGRSRELLQDRFDRLFAGGTVDETVFHELEDALLGADVGVPTTERLLQRVRAAAQKNADSASVRKALRDEIRGVLVEVEAGLGPPPEKPPWVILVVGVNGSGKTTTIGKLAARLVRSGKKVLLAAGDTYRAAGSEQLSVWAERAGADIVMHPSGADPGAVVYDALQSALARQHDVVIVDTAGRLQTRKPLMEQLAKIRRVIAKVVPAGPHETLLVLDGTMGQNALSQARLFHEVTPITGVAVVKLDGTAKGGMVLTIASELRIPVKLVGIGEKIDDLRDFEVDAFVEALA